METYKKCTVDGVEGWSISEWPDDSMMVLPDEHEGLPVIQIDRYAIANHKHMKSLVLPRGLIRIEDGAFVGCTSLLTVVIPSSVRYAGHEAFMECESLKDVSFASSQDELALGKLDNANDEYVLGQSAFEKCWHLERVELRSGLSVIDKCTFRDCIRLCSIRIPAGVKYIGDSAFRGCKSILEITLPETIERLGWGAFSECKCLCNVDSLRDQEHPDKEFQLGGFVFQDCENLESVRLPEGVRCINQGCFAGCGHLVAVNILGDGNSVAYLATGAFKDCYNLSQLPEMPNLKLVARDVFTNCEKLKSFPESTWPEEYTGVF